LLYFFEKHYICNIVFIIDKDKYNLLRYEIA